MPRAVTAIASVLLVLLVSAALLLLRGAVASPAVGATGQASPPSS